MTAIGIRSKLLPSVIFLSAFYWLFSLFLFLLKSRTSAGVDTKRFLTWLMAELNEQRAILQDGLIWNFQGILIAVMVGLSVVIISLKLHQFVIRQSRSRENKWRGLTTSIGAMPASVRPNIRKASITDRRIDSRYLPLLNDIFGYLFSAGDLSSGPGHGCNLYNHSMNVFMQSLDRAELDPLLPVIAASHDIGKAAKHFDPRLSALRHSQLSSTCLAMMPTWWSLSDKDRSLLSLVLEYYHCPTKLPRSVPLLDDDDQIRLRRLIGEIRQLDSSNTAEEKSVVVANSEKVRDYVDLFWEALSDSPFQTPTIAKGVKAVGWRKGGYLYILATGVAQKVLEGMDDDLLAALREAPFSRHETLDVVVDKLRGFLLDRDLLIVRVDDSESPSGLWNIKSGDHQFKNVFIVEEGKAPFELPALTRYAISDVTPAKSVVVNYPTSSAKVKPPRETNSQDLEAILSHAINAAGQSSVGDSPVRLEDPAPPTPSVDLSFLGLVVPKSRA